MSSAASRVGRRGVCRGGGDIGGVGRTRLGGGGIRAVAFFVAGVLTGIFAAVLGIVRIRGSGLVLRRGKGLRQRGGGEKQHKAERKRCESICYCVIFHWYPPVRSLHP